MHVSHSSSLISEWRPRARCQASLWSCVPDFGHAWSRRQNLEACCERRLVALPQRQMLLCERKECVATSNTSCTVVSVLRYARSHSPFLLGDRQAASPGPVSWFLLPRSSVFKPISPLAVESKGTKTGPAHSTQNLM